MVKGVEFTNIRLFEEERRRMPNFVLHELAHAYHDRELPQAMGNAQIKALYDKARLGGTYDKVERRYADGKTKIGLAYAMTTPQEYFAESTEAYFSQNDFFPYNRAELEKHDPEMAKLVGALWEKPTP